MMKNVMKAGAVSAALAAATLLTPAAQAAHDQQRYAPVTRAPAHDGGWSNGQNHHSDFRGDARRHQNGRLSKWERRHAVRQCEQAIQHRTYRVLDRRDARADYKFRPNVERIGRDTIRVSAPVLVSTRWDRSSLPSSCIVNDGRVLDLRFNPRRVFADKHDHDRRRGNGVHLSARIGR